MSNPLLSLISTAISPILTQIEAALGNIAANPTVENTVTQGEGLVADAINPSQLEGVSIGSIATEASTLVADLQTKLASATVAPVVSGSAEPIA